MVAPSCLLVSRLGQYARHNAGKPSSRTGQACRSPDCDASARPWVAACWVAPSSQAQSTRDVGLKVVLRSRTAGRPEISEFGAHDLCLFRYERVAPSQTRDRVETVAR